jgi:Ca2+-binding RTX toxin-like protein
VFDGADRLNGGIDQDILKGGLGNDFLLGEAGNDYLYRRISRELSPKVY